MKNKHNKNTCQS